MERCFSFFWRCMGRCCFEPKRLILFGFFLIFGFVNNFFCIYLILCFAFENGVVMAMNLCLKGRRMLFVYDSDL